MVFFDPDFGALLGGDFEDVYDHHGNGVLTKCCHVYMMWDSQSEKYICPKCGKSIVEENF